jgi:hypothetical protein
MIIAMARSFLSRVRKKGEIDFTVFFWGSVLVILAFLMLWYVLSIFAPELKFW